MYPTFFLFRTVEGAPVLRVYRGRPSKTPNLASSLTTTLILPVKNDNILRSKTGLSRPPGYVTETKSKYIPTQKRDTPRAKKRKLLAARIPFPSAKSLLVTGNGSWITSLAVKKQKVIW